MTPILRLATACLLFATTSVSSFAAEPDAAIKYRQSVMKVIGGSTTAIGAILKGEAGKKEDLAALTRILASAADPAIVDAAFEQNTDSEGSEKTTANSEIWSEWQEFTKITAAFSKAADAAAAKGAEVGFRDLKPVFAQCKACHKAYREK
ncbi:MAG: cytochrome c [Pseudomonadota bacterium]